jgi:hypothetical protein
LWHTFFGVVLGIHAALQLQSWIDRKSKSELMRLLKDSLRYNQDLLTQLEKEFNVLPGSKTEFPLYPLDLTLLDATAHRKYELGISSEVCQKIDKARYELNCLDGKLLLMRDSWSRGNTQQAHQVMNSCKEGLTKIKQVIEDAHEIL